MPPVSLPIHGPSNTLAVRNQSVERSVNFMVESTAPGNAKTERTTRWTPGLLVLAACGSGFHRGSSQLNDRAFVVVSSLLVEVFSNGTATTRGTVSDDNLPVSMASNGTAGDQLLVIAAGNGYILTLSTNAFAQIADADFPDDAGMCWFMDGYFGVTIKDTRRFQISALEDGTSWDALDVAERSEAADNIAAQVRNHREIWTIGVNTTEVWYDNGDPLFPFAPIQGVFVEIGTVAPFSVCRFDNTIGFITLDERGHGMCVRMNGYTPERFSTTAVEGGEHGFSNSSDMGASQSWALQMRGHLFVYYYVPGLRTTWVYDVPEQAWHELGLWDSTLCRWDPDVFWTGMFAFGKALVGSRLDDTLYELNLTQVEDELT